MDNDFVLTDLEITDNIEELNITTYYVIKPLNEILADLSMNEKSNDNLINFCINYRENAISKMGKNEIILPRWIIPIIETNVMKGHPELKFEQTVALVKDINKTLGLLEYKTNMNKLNRVYMPTQRLKNQINIRDKLDNKYVFIPYSRDAVTNIDGKLSMLSNFRIFSNEYELKYIYTEYMDIKINKNVYYNTQYFIQNTDILSREYIIAHMNNYSTVGFLKIPLRGSYLKYDYIINKKIKECKNYKNLYKSNCIIEYNNINRYLKELFKSVFRNVNNIMNIRDIYKIIKFLDLDIKINTKIINKLLRNKESLDYYTPPVFIDNFDFAQETNEKWEKIKHLYNNIDYKEDINLNLFNSNDNGQLYYAAIQEGYSTEEINRKLTELTNILKQMTGAPEEFKDDNIIKELNINNDKLKLINNELYILHNEGSINRLIKYEDYKLIERINRVKNLMTYLEDLKTNKFRIDYEMSLIKLKINNKINSQVKQIRVNIDKAIYKPTDLYCYVKSNRKFYNVNYLSKLFYINENDKCVLYETNEELWCKHEIYDIEDCSINVNDIIKCKYCDTTFDVKMNSGSGFTNGKPNLFHSGTIIQEQNLLSIIINVLINTFFKKLNMEYKTKIINLLDDYFIEYDKLNLLIKTYKIREYELAAKLNLKNIERAIRAFRKYKESTKDKITFDFNITNSEVFVDSNFINKFYALMFFYIFNDVITKIIAIYELIMGKRIKTLVSNWKSYWNIGFLELDSKFNYDYFYNIYYEPLDKNVIKEKYVNIFQVLKQTEFIKKNKDVKYTEADIINKDRFVFNNLKMEDINENNYYMKNNAIALKNLINVDVELFKNVQEINSLKLGFMNFNLNKNEIYLSYLNLEDYEQELMNEKQNLVFIEPSLCITGMSIYENSLIYNNYEYMKYLKNKNNSQYKIYNEYENNIKMILELNKTTAPSEGFINYKIQETKEILYHSLKKKNLMTYSYVLPSEIVRGPSEIKMETKMESEPTINKPNLKTSLSKDKVKNILNNIYNYKYTKNIINYLNYIDINIDKNNKLHVLKFGNFLFDILNSKLLKQKKNELNKSIVNTKYEYKSLLINKNDNIRDYENSYKINYKNNIAGDLNIIKSLTKIETTVEEEKDVSISTLQNNNNVILNKFNYDNYYNTLYKSWYNTFLYLHSIIANNKTKTASEMDLKLFKKNNYISTLHNNIIKFNVKPKIKYSYIFEYSFEELQIIYKYYKTNYGDYNDYSDNIYIFINTLYSKAFILELYYYIINLCGLEIELDIYMDITTIYNNNKTVIDTINKLYKTMFEHMYSILLFAQPLDKEMTSNTDKYYLDKFKKTENNYNIGFTEDDMEDSSNTNEYDTDALLENDFQLSNDAPGEEEDFDIFADEDMNENEEDILELNNKQIIEDENNILEVIIEENDIVI
jgi:hypothetical protein